ncbi:hypothetical protein [Streptomyces sp. NBC_00878]|uniref:hypothetical protein n=1 Tax=Streptomyces sp. NBC_00878 TaxID=2975854 RepID=UPI002250F5E8|nr:hypothetical protein [Streptomyces sp. NBC_00878]MCX4908956.1 hypothetical protein [Streptomyces sp. NBC_00878]
MNAPIEDPRERFARTNPALAKQNGDPVTDPAGPADLAATLPPAEPAATLHLPEPAAAEGAEGAGGSERSEGETRFGPGVPGARGGTGDRAADVWRGIVTPGALGAPGTPARRRRRRGLWPFLLVLAVVVAVVIGIRFWMSAEPPLDVSDVLVETPTVDRCAKTVVITGVVSTNGSSGTVDYRWKRSDGTTSGVLHQQVGKNAGRFEAVLRWSFDGRGTVKATATLEVLSPNPKTASADFTYDCP